MSEKFLIWEILNISNDFVSEIIILFVTSLFVEQKSRYKKKTKIQCKIYTSTYIYILLLLYTQQLVDCRVDILHLQESMCWVSNEHCFVWNNIYLI